MKRTYTEDTKTAHASSTGGTITYTVDREGNRVGLIHRAGTAYSGAIAQKEEKKPKGLI